MQPTIHVGYEVGTGEPVSIPLRHLAVTGQTQESGKTTTLEALIDRSQLRAIAFVTKRSEGSFDDARRLQPYFRERADWQFVSAVLEATLRERMKFQRPWIMKICRGARTLADVDHNVKKALKTAKGLSESVYYELQEYLQIVIPQIASTKFAAGVDLQPGVNVMDLANFTTEMQGLVIRSVMEWIYEREQNTVTIIPEAWEFIPQARSSPVFLAFEALIRKGAAAKNYVWIDSQDMAGVNKIALRGVPVWLIGVQRETNEVKRALANIPDAITKPKAKDIALLRRGEFYVCYSNVIKRTYVQPVWLTDDDAIAVARNEEIPRPAPEREEKTMAYDGEKARLEQENRELKNKIHELTLRIEDLTRDPEPEPVREVAKTYTATESMDNEQLYQAIKKRLISEAPALLRVLAKKSEIEVRVERRTIEASGDTLRGRIAMLIAEDFFASERKGTAVESELRRVAFPCSRPNVYRELDKLANDGFLTKENDGYLAVEGMKVNIIEAA